MKEPDYTTKLMSTYVGMTSKNRKKDPKKIYKKKIDPQRKKLCTHSDSPTTFSTTTLFMTKIILATLFHTLKRYVSHSAEIIESSCICLLPVK